MRRRRRKDDTPPHPDRRVQAIFVRRKPKSPKVDLSAVTDVVTEGDPLFMVNHLYEETTLRDSWKHGSGFLVCGGPSAKEVDYMRLAERGVVSLGVNNCAGSVPVTAFTCSDPPRKFHHGIWLDPKLLKLVPFPKLKHTIRIKQDDGKFYLPKIGPRPWKVRDCPNVYGYLRNCEFIPEKFLTSNAATWGHNSKAIEKHGGDKLLFTMFLGLRLLHYLGLRRVYLLGVDFHMRPNYGYGFGQERTEGACRSNNNSYKTASKWLRQLRPILEDAGMQVYNTYQQSSLEAFDYVPFDAAISDCKQALGKEPFDLAGWYEK